MKILLIVTGSIAAVKSYDLVRELRAKQHQVTVVLTHSAQRFVTIEAMTTLSGQKVYTDLFDLDLEEEIGHIALSRQADIILIAPATAHFIAQIAHGMCDNLATTLISAANKPIYIAPAMNPYMWQNQANLKNIDIVKQLYPNIVHFIGPEKGLMACGEKGTGRMSEVSQIIEAINNPHEFQRLKSQKILITLGATLEKIDPVRFISNFSSGKQGLALAEEALRQGAEVKLVIGKITTEISQYIKKHPLATCIKVKSADEMYKITLASLPIDIAICTAAVCDWKPVYQDQKIKKKNNQDNLTLNFIKNPDILASISRHKHRPRYVIGFAAETENLVKNAQKKLIDKRVDVIYANQTDENSNIFGSDHNKIIEIRKNSQKKLEKCSKIMVSKWIIDQIPDEILNN